MQNTLSNETMGTINCSNHTFGLLCKIKIKHIKPGAHGIHIHAINSCKNKGMAALGHLQTANQQHMGPYEPKSHLGDLPEIFADKNGNITSVILAPRLNVKAITNKSIIIHEFGDNYSDSPQPLGGGGARIACGTAN